MSEHRVSSYTLVLGYATVQIMTEGCLNPFPKSTIKDSYQGSGLKIED
jgi:hypothetical protein